MITYIDSENRQDYTVLFNKASTKLGLMPIVKETRDPDTHEIVKEYFKKTWDTERLVWTDVECEYTTDANGKKVYAGIDTVNDVFTDVKPIASLNEYFQHIKDLAGLAIGQGRAGSDPYFLRLPLDEPFFEINANTRGITVPGELSQIAVRGDKLAEVVFFRIDRYYDAIDLNTRHIYIEWELPDGTKGISRDFLRDTQSEKDKIIFGWAIGEELTQQVGTIRFAVRFVEWFDKADGTHRDDRDANVDTADKGAQILYSFSSLPATVSVVDSLNYSLFENDEALKIYNTAVTNKNIGTMILYLEDSDSDVEGETSPLKAELPRFVRDLTKAFYTNASDSVNAEGEYTINLVDGKLELRVEATSDDGGQISYVFGHIAHTKGEGTGIAPTGATGLVAKIKFVESDVAFIEEDGQMVFNESRTFYTTDGTGAFVVVGKNDAVQGETYYERVAYIEAAAPGHYYAIADNRVGGMKTNSKHSSTIYIPWADKPQIVSQMHNGENVVLNKMDMGLTIDPEFNEAAMSNRGYTNVRVSSEQAEEYIPEVTLQPIASAVNKSEEFTYQWYKHADNHWAQKNAEHLADYTRPTAADKAVSDEDWAEIEAQLLTDDKWVPVGTGTSYTTNKPGMYAVKIVNSFNNDYRATDLFEAGLIRVTDMPELPSIDWTTFSETFNRGDIPEGISVSILKGQDENDENVFIDYDEIRYQWHKVTIPTTDNPEYIDDFEYATNAQMTPASDTLTFNAQGIAVIPFEPHEFGSYYLEITNTLNGATAYYSSAGDMGTGVIRIEQVTE